MECRLETDRLTLRPFAASDLDWLHQLWTHADVRRYLWDGIEIGRERAAEEISKSRESFQSHGFGFWAVLLKEDNALIGFCGLRVFGDASDVEILYGIAPGHWGKGLATEAARATLRYGFETCRLAKIYAGADAPNEASIKVMAKLGMTYEGPRTINGIEAVYYSINNSRHEETAP